ncbi:ATP-binding protein [Atrimonas thermophila]|uniref:ATP-binding protein n=1 Tax=Atrimonas thermophila TaxID=3064161 RepID=UPI00399CB919
MKSISSLQNAQGNTQKKVCSKCGEEIALRRGEHNGITFAYFCRCDYEERMRAFTEREEAEKKQRVEELFKDARIGRRYHSCTLDSFKQELNPEAYRAVLRYVQDIERNVEKGIGLVLCGPVGTGKTHLAVAVLKEAIGAGYSGLFQTAPELMYRWNATYSSSGTTEEEFFRTLRDVRFLVIDDLGKGKWSERVAERLYAVINARYNELNPTVITTNLVGQDLRKYVGDAIADRLYDSCLFIEFKGKSFRVARLKGENGNEAGSAPTGKD